VKIKSGSIRRMMTSLKVFQVGGKHNSPLYQEELYLKGDGIGIFVSPPEGGLEEGDWSIFPYISEVKRPGGRERKRRTTNEKTNPIRLLRWGKKRGFKKGRILPAVRMGSSGSINLKKNHSFGNGKGHDFSGGEKKKTTALLFKIYISTRKTTQNKEGRRSVAQDCNPERKEAL